MVTISLSFMMAGTAHAEDDPCFAEFVGSDAYRNSPANVRWLNGYDALSSECQTSVAANPAFREQLAGRIKQYYEGPISQGLTVDVEAYERMSDLAGRSVPAEARRRLNVNREQAQRRCGGEREVDQREKLPPVRNQGSTGWCASFVAADLASFESGQTISARQVALDNYGQQVNEDVKYNRLNEDAARQIALAEQEGGFPESAHYRSLDAGGFCLEDEVPSEGTEQEDIADTIAIFKELDEKVEGMDPEQRTQAVDRFCQENAAMLNEQFPAGFTQDNMNALFAHAGDNSYAHLSKQQCQNRIQVEGKVDINFQSSGEMDVMADVDHALDQGGIISVNYYPDLLGHGEELDENGDSTPHASTIIGRRWDAENNRCQYLLRNSWGQDCGIYPDEANVTCEDGNLWVFADELAGHAYGSAAYSKYLRPEAGE